MTTPTVRTQLGEHGGSHIIATVEVDNSARLNCLSTDQVVRLKQAFDELSQHDTLRAVILTCAGDKSFNGVARIVAGATSHGCT